MQHERGDFTADIVGDKVVVVGGMGKCNISKDVFVS